MAIKAVSDILVYDGSSFVSVKTGKIRRYDGSSFVVTGTDKDLIFDGTDWCYVVSAGTFATRQSVVLSSTVPSYTTHFTAVPDAEVTVLSKPDYLDVTINNDTNTITYEYRDYHLGWKGNVVLRCANGATDILVGVFEFEN